MKKIGLLFLLVFLLSACGSTSPTTQPAVQPAQPAVATAALPPTAAQPAAPATEAQPAAATADPATAAQPAAKLDGAALLQDRCADCHSPDIVQRRPQSKDQWDRTVSNMIDRGAQLNDAEKQALVDYLAQTYGK
jgi:cytochrome c5